MKSRHFIASWICAPACGLMLSLMIAPAQASAAADSAVQPVLSRMAGLPLCFEAVGDAQEGGSTQFRAAGRNYNFLLAPNEARLLFRDAEIPAPSFRSDSAPFVGARAGATRAVRMAFVGANSRAPIQGQELLAAQVNYLKGGDPARWHLGIPTWSKVGVQDLYPGVDLVYYGNQQRLEYDFTVAPGTNPAVIAIHFDGVDKVQVSSGGELVLKAGGDEIRQPAPILYQVADGRRRAVNGGYRLRNTRTVEFVVGKYDHSLPLIIDPVLVYSTLIGGSAGTSALAVKVDASGSIYLAGVTLATEFAFDPTNAFQATSAGGTFDGDGFVAKLDSTGTNLIFFTYLGGSDDDAVFDMALDSSNNVYLTGFTDSTNFPVAPAGGVPGLPGGTHIGGTVVKLFDAYRLDCFVTELGAGGSNLVFSTYLGGSAADVGSAIAVDASNYVYVTGYTRSTDFPTTNALVVPSPGGGPPRVFDHSFGGSKVFVTKFAPAGSGLVYSTYLGGDTYSVGEGIAADAAGFAYVTGGTTAANFPVTSDALQFFLNLDDQSTNQYPDEARPPFDIFVSRIAPLGSTLVYSTFLGGTNDDVANRLALDANTNVYITGYSGSPDFPTTVPTSVIQNGVTNGPLIYTNLPPGGTNGPIPNADAFLVKMNFSSEPPTMVYSALFGGTNNDAGWDVVVDTSGNAFVIGTTGSPDFPTANAFGYLTATNNGYRDVFVTVFNTNATALPYSVCLGGRGNDYGYGIALDAQDDAYVVGRTHSIDFPTVNPFEPPQRWNNAFLAKIQMAVPTNSVVIQTAPANLPIVVDGANVTAPVTNNWLYGSVHTIGSAATNSGGSGVQYVWTSWSDGGFLSHEVTVSTNVTITATYNTQYFLTVSNSLGGVASPASGWYNAGISVSISASPGMGNTFTGWAGAGVGSFSGSNPLGVVVMEEPISESASFNGPLTDVLTIVINGNGSVAPNYNGQALQAGNVYKVRAVPNPGNVFLDWTGGPGGTTPELTFTMRDGLVLEANFIPQPFLAAGGVYSGLFFDTNDVTFASSGFFNATLSPNGSFTAKLRVGAQPYSLSGQFSIGGAYATSIIRSNQPPLQIALALALSGSNAITGQISDGSWTSDLAAYRNIYSAFSSPANAGVNYTWIIPGGANSRTAPGGDSFGFLRIGAAGGALFGGTLADGSSVSETTFVTPQGQVPFYVPLYSGGGSIFGWLTFTNAASNDISGAVYWFKPPRPQVQIYAGGFALQSALAGSIYNNGGPLLSFTQGQLVLEGTQFSRVLTNFNATNPVSINSQNSVVGQGVNIAIAPASGLFQGVVADPVTGQPLAVRGAVVQKMNLAAGYFFLERKSGAVFLEP